MGSAFEWLDSVLSWDNAAGSEVLQDIHRETLSAELGGASQVRTALGQCEALSPERCDRIKYAPRTWLLAIGVPDEGALASHLNDAVLADAAEHGKVDSVPRAAWSADGSIFFAAGKVRPSRSHEHRWPSPRYTAPMLRNGVSVDFWSPTARGDLPEVSGANVDPTPGEIELVVERLDDALGRMEQASRVSYEIVGSFSRVLVVRKDPDGVGSFTAASSPTAPMRPILRNPHRAEATTADIADGWVHETIHCLFDLAEIHDPAFADPSAARRVRFDSPWTGRSLDANTYAQACVVWYGLWHFWSRALLADAWPRQTTLRSMARAAWGFVQCETHKPFDQFGSEMSSALRAMLERCQQSVRGEAEGILSVLNEWT